MEFDQQDIDQLLDKWYQTKKQIATLEKNILSYKIVAETIMDYQDDDTLQNKHYKLSRKDIDREVLYKSDVPTTIWREFSRKITYPVYNISLRKE